MPTTERDKWTGFLLSLALPGAGQWWAGDRSFLAWLAAAAFIAIGPVWCGFSGPLSAILGGAAMVAVGLASAEHAKRTLEHRPPWRPTSGVTSQVDCPAPRRGIVRLQLHVDIPRPVAEVWPRVADLANFLRLDPFHTRVTCMGPELRPGVDLAIEHSVFGCQFLRFGRVLRWREGRGYAISDLSARGPRRGFPHVFFIDLSPLDSGNQSRLTIRVRVRGRWSRWTPAWLGGLWLRYVMHEHARLLRAGM